MVQIAKWLKKYFIPHKGNEYRPHSLRHESMMVFLLVIMTIQIGFLIQVFVIFDKTNFLASVLPGVLTSLTNAEREDNDVPPLTENPLLAQAAELKAQDMAEKGYFAHTSPEGRTPWYWLKEVGYSYSYAGENLAVNFFESDDVARAWMNSPTHRANIVKDKYTEIGIGVASGVYKGKDTVFVAQFFGTPVGTAPVVIPAPTPAPAPVVRPTPEPAPEPIPTPTPTPTPTPVPEPEPTPEPEPSPTEEPLPVITPPVVAITPVIAPNATQILGEESVAVTKSFAQRVLSSPRQYTTYAFGGILFILITAMGLVAFMRSEASHPALIARGTALVAVVLLMIFLDTQILTLDTTQVPTDGVSASVISSSGIAY